MDRLEAYFDILPLPLVFAAAAMIALGFFAIPAHKQLFFSLAAVPVWLTLAQLPGLVKARRADPSRLPPRAKRDARLLPEIQRVYDENSRVYGPGRSGSN